MKRTIIQISILALILTLISAYGMYLDLPNSCLYIVKNYIPVWLAFAMPLVLMCKAIAIPYRHFKNK